MGDVIVLIWAGRQVIVASPMYSDLSHYMAVPPHIISFSEVVDRGKGFFETPIEYQRFSGNLTLFCYYYIPYFTHKS